jgi:hypothetical protein
LLELLSMRRCRNAPWRIGWSHTAKLLRSGLAVAEHEMIEPGDKLVAVAKVRITQAGWKALAES